VLLSHKLNKLKINQEHNAVRDVYYVYTQPRYLEEFYNVFSDEREYVEIKKYTHKVCSSCQEAFSIAIIKINASKEFDYLNESNKLSLWNKRQRISYDYINKTFRVYSFNPQTRNINSHEELWFKQLELNLQEFLRQNELNEPQVTLNNNIITLSFENGLIINATLNNRDVLFSSNKPLKVNITAYKVYNKITFQEVGELAIKRYTLSNKEEQIIVNERIPGNLTLKTSCNVVNNYLNCSNALSLNLTLNY